MRRRVFMIFNVINTLTEICAVGWTPANHPPDLFVRMTCAVLLPSSVPLEAVPRVTV